MPALKAALVSKEYWVRQAAADALSKLNNSPRSEPSLATFSDAVFYKRSAALQAMIQMLTDWDRDLRLAAAEALGRLADHRAVPPLTVARGDRDPWVRSSAEQALRRLGVDPPQRMEAAPEVVVDLQTGSRPAGPPDLLSF